MISWLGHCVRWGASSVLLNYGGNKMESDTDDNVLFTEIGKEFDRRVSFPDDMCWRGMK